jgi:hypothetical protein
VSLAWMGQTETDRAELDALSAYLRERGTVPSTAVPCPLGASGERHTVPGADRNPRLKDGAGPPCCRPGVGDSEATVPAEEPRPVPLTAIRRLRRRP